MFVKFGLGLMGSNNVMLPILGERVFPIRLAGLEPAARRHAGDEPADGRARRRARCWARSRREPGPGSSQERLRLGILGGFVAAAVGYVAVGMAPSAWWPSRRWCWRTPDRSTVWVFSTTLLQVYTDDKFRGRVFAADVGLLTLTISLSSYVGGAAIDWGMPVRSFAA